MSRRHRRKRNLARKQRNAERAKALFEPCDVPSDRPSRPPGAPWTFEVRGGWSFSFAFSGIPVPFEDEDDPSKDLVTKTQLALAVERQEVKA